MTTGPTVPTITPAQRAQLGENVFFVLPDVFTRTEMARLAEIIEGYQRMHQERLRAQGRTGDGGISRADEITFTDHLAEQDDAIRAFVSRPEFVAITTQLLGPNVDLYWNQSVFKQPQGVQEFPWHQDDGYTPVYPYDLLNALPDPNVGLAVKGVLWNDAYD